MAYQRKDNTFSAFKNTRRSKDTHPQLTGDAMIDGQAYWVNVWTKKDKNGDTYISGSIQKKDLSKAKDAVKSGGDDFEDSIPFNKREDIYYV